MHEPVKANLEEYLAESTSLPREFMAHLLTCEGCRRELAELRAQSTLVRVLRYPEEVEPRVGFYARVIDSIEAQRQSTIWSIILEPAFGRRLAMASAVLAVLMGLYLVDTEPGGSRIMTGRGSVVMAALPGEDGPVLGADQDQDRGAVLVNLATYRQGQ